MKMLYSHFATKSYVKALYKEGSTEPVAYQYIYNYTDHLGNIRLSYTFDEETGEVKTLEENHYYPFGLKHGFYNKELYEIALKQQAQNEKEVKQTVKKGYNYKYNGKELQDVPIAIGMGLNVYDYGARIYDPAVSRFWTVDPLAEKYNFQSPYVYADNNPVRFMDINGMGVDDIYIDENGNYLGTDGAETKDVRVVSKKTWNDNGGQAGAQTESGTEYLQKSEKSTLLVGESEKQPGYQKPITISSETKKCIVDAGGEIPKATINNTTDSTIFIQPEHTVDKGPGTIKGTDIVEVKPGESIYGGIDGVKTEAHKNNEVTKVPTGSKVKLDKQGNTDIVNFLESMTFGKYGVISVKKNTYFKKLSKSIQK